MVREKNKDKPLRSADLQSSKRVQFSPKHGEKAQSRAQQRMSNILESVTDGLFAVDKDWRFTYLNQSGEEALKPIHKSAQRLIGKSFWEAFPQTHGTEIERNFRRAHAEHVTVEFDAYFEPADRWVEFHVYPSSDGLSVFFRDITERHRAREVLSASERRLRSAFHQAAVGMVVASLEGRIEQVNAYLVQLLGYSADELIGKSYLDITHPDDRVKSRENIVHLLAGEQEDFVQEKRYQRKNAEVVWGLTSGTLIKSASKSPEKLILAIGDISQRVEAEELRSRLAAVVESSDDAIISMGLDATIQTWNKGAEQMFGYRASEVVGRSVKILIPSYREDEEPGIVNRLLDGERIEHYETVRIRKDGTPINVSLTVSPMYDGNGGIVGVSKISRDITEKKRADEALNAEARLLELLNDTGKAIASELDLQNVAQTVTDSATALIGARYGAFFYNFIDSHGEAFLLYALSGAPRELFEGFGDPHQSPLFAPTFRGAPPIRSDDLTQDARFERSAHFGSSDTQLPVRSYLAIPVLSRTGEVIGGLFFGHPESGFFSERSKRLIVGMAAQAAIAIDNARLFDGAQQEIHRRKRVEEALRHAQSELEHHAERLEDEVTERTARLRETIQELEAFSYSVSHDIRSPLRAMHSYADALIDEYKDKLDDQALEYLERIRRSAARMDLLIQDLLAYSRVAKSDIQLRSVNIEEVIADVIQNYPALQPGKASIAVTSPIPSVLGHEAYLTQIISNFLGNAVKFVPVGTTPIITIRATVEGDNVRITFKDNGIGIAPEHHNRIFQIFGRVDSEENYEGTGIGLAITKKAAERMGGSVGVVSEPSHGSEFFVLLQKAT